MNGHTHTSLNAHPPSALPSFGAKSIRKHLASKSAADEKSAYDVRVSCWTVRRDAGHRSDGVREQGKQAASTTFFLHKSRSQTRMRWIFGSMLGVTHALDVATAIWFYILESKPDVLQPARELDFSFEHAALDALTLAVIRAILFPLLIFVAVHSRPKIVVEQERPSTESGPPPEGGYIRLNDASRDECGENTSTKRIVASRGARSPGWAIAGVFIISTACQIFTGIKVNGYKWRGDSWGQVVLLCLSVLWTNVAAFLAREIITELTRDEALYLPKVHAHGLVFDPTICRHMCDLCSTRILTGGAYRCKLCDFDICLKCAGRDDAAIVGENVLRTDSAAKTERTLSSTSYLARAMNLARSRWGTQATAIVVLALYSSISLALPSYQGKIIDKIVKNNRRQFYVATRTYLVLMLVQGALRATYSAMFSIVSRSILYEIRTKLFASIVRQDIAFFDGTTSGHLSSRLTNDAQTMMAPIDASLSSLLYNSILLVGGVTMCFYTSYSLAMLAFVVVGPITTMWDAYSRWSKQLTRRVLACWAEANSLATEALNHIRVVKAFAAEEAETLHYNEACFEGLRLGIRDALGNGLTTAVTGYLDLGTGVLILWYGGLIVLKGGQGLTVGRLIQFQLYWNMMNNAYQSLQGLVTSFTRAAAAAEKVFSLIDSMPDIDTSQSARKVDWHVEGHLALENVEFYYSMRPEKVVLNGITLSIPASSTVALVGRSGGGKSTIISLLLRFYDPKRGKVTLDGVDIAALDVREYRRHFGVVMQDMPLFARSIRRNIAYGLDDDGVALADIAAAAKKALAYDFVEQMLDKFETRVGERGGRLSGGQRQRVAIARVFLRKPRLVLLDEATSALDEESQAAVQQALDALIALGESTVVLVAHRLSTVIAADKIVVVDGGRILEEGSHRDLVAKPDGVYAALVAKQVAKAAQHIDDKSHATETNRPASDSVDRLLDEINSRVRAA